MADVSAGVAQGLILKTSFFLICINDLSDGLKVNFNPVPDKHVQGIIFSRMKTVSLHPVVHFDINPVKSTQIHHHVGMMLDSNLIYEHHFKSNSNKTNKTVDLLHKFQLILPRDSLITIYKIFVSPHLQSRTKYMEQNGIIQ